MRVNWRTVALLAGLLVLGCGPAGRSGRGSSRGSDGSGGSTSGGTGGSVCTPPASIACTCDDGAAGVAACVQDGSRYGVCNCTGASACTPLATEACTCSDGAAGVATCLSDGSRFDVCVCTPALVCTPGSTEACTCAGGASGTKGCAIDGSGWGSCACGSGCPDGGHDGGDGVCVPAGSCSPGYVLESGRCVADQGCANGPVARLTAPAQVQAGATVQLDASASTGSGLSYSWNVTMPSGSSSALAPVARPTFVAEAAGSYTVALTVTDGGSCESSTSAVVVAAGTTGGGTGGGTATTHALRVQLNWTGDSSPNVGDLDLHLVGPAAAGGPGTFFDAANSDVALMCLLGGAGGLGGGLPLASGTDVYWNDTQPDWSATSTDADCDQTDDPKLDLTSDWGGVSTPEEITWAKAFTGSFVVGAHYYCSRQNLAAQGQTPVYSASLGSVHATVTVYVDGQPRATWTSGRLTQRDLWQAGTISVSTSGVAFAASSTVTKTQDLGSLPTGCTADTF